MGVAKLRFLVVFIIAATFLLPLCIYFLFIGRAPSITAGEAVEQLSQTNTNALLIDVRSPAAYETAHLEGALNWPHENIRKMKSKSEVPALFWNRRLFLLCDGGIESALAAKRLRALSVEAYNVKGGLQQWIGTPSASCLLGLCRLQTASGQNYPLPSKEMNLFEQLTACIAAFGVKPLYMALSLALVMIMRRVKAPDLVALRWALIFFFVGEGFCATNYLFFSEASNLVEYLHSFGMVVAFGFTTYAVFEGIDLRLVKYSAPDEKCAALGLCGACIKYTDVPCGLRRIFQWVIPCFIILAFIPLLASLHATSYNANIFGTFYNYSHSVIFQMFEIRYAPVVATLSFGAAFISLLIIKKDPVLLTKIFFAAGMGFFGFSMFRLIFFGLYRDNLAWFIWWEEATEFLYIGMAAGILWIFRHRLFLEKAS